MQTISIIKYIYMHTCVHMYVFMYIRMCSKFEQKKREMERLQLPKLQRINEGHLQFELRKKTHGKQFLKAFEFLSETFCAFEIKIASKVAL